MTLRRAGFVDLPAHRSAGGFDHAAVHQGRRRLFVAHTANDAVDVISLDRDEYIGSIEGLPGVAGALVSDELDLVFTSNRAADAVSVISADDHRVVSTIQVGSRPNGLALDETRGTLLVAGVGEPYTLTIVDVDRAVAMASIPAPGRTRWAVHDPRSGVFFVNIADPPEIVVIDAARPDTVARTIPIDFAGPHGLDLDTDVRLFCACDEGRLLFLDPPSYESVGDVALAGAPDVIFLDQVLGRVYVAIGDPGLVQVVDVLDRSIDETVATELGAHTLALDPARHRVYVFLPMTHRAVILEDSA